jgi:methyl halide transferase
MSKKDIFNERYEAGNTPWELERPDFNLVNMIKKKIIKPCKALDIGCGTGHNIIWLAKQGFKGAGTDFSHLAIKEAKKKAEQEGVSVKFFENDFLTDKIGDANFDFLFDRGCLHSFDQIENRKQFAKNAFYHLNHQGLWLSLIGNADEIRDSDAMGPPQRKDLAIILDD